MDDKFMLYFSVVIACLFGISEGLAMIPSIKSNSVYQAIANILKALVKKDSL